jgi:hypothetical protein
VCLDPHLRTDTARRYTKAANTQSLSWKIRMIAEKSAAYLTRTTRGSS